MLDKGEIPAVEFRRPLLDFLAEEYDQDDFVETFSMALECYWRGDPEDCARLIGKQQPRSSDTDVLISKNQLLLRKLGHYSSAVMLYAGEWYWGVDRLHYLTSRLDALRLRRKDEDGEELASLEQAMQMNLPAQVPAKATSLSSLEMFYSFRSPYSYLALKRMYAIANAFGLKLEIRPVLPMVMRGLPVPKQKQMYIIKDANREAERNGIAFGKIFDPLGQGVERCLAVLEYAREQSREREFLLTVGHATWALGIDIATDEGMRRVTEKAGLFWPDVMAAMQDEAWKARAEENGESMLESGIWGVPCLRIGSCALWGQDRTWLLARQIEDMCQDGDGILT
jgi:2-hydroxychromene-2-carboxylate isomerase